MAPRFHSGDLAVSSGRPPTTASGTSSPTTADAAHRRPAPHHRGQGQSLRHQGRQQRLRRSRRARTRATWSASCRVRVAARRPRPALAAHALHGRAALRRHGRCCSSWAPSSAVAAATVAGRSRSAASASSSRSRTAARPRGDPRRRHADHLHRLRRGRRRLPRARRARLHAARRPSPSAHKTPYTEKVSLRLPRQGARRAGLPRRRREHGRPDLPQARAPRPRQGSLPPGGQGPAAASAARWRSSCASRARPAGAAPSSSPRPSASPATTPPPTSRSTCRRLQSLIRKVERLTGELRRLRLHPRGHAARAPGRARWPASRSPATTRRR